VHRFAAISEWRNPATPEDIRTFATLTCEPNEMMATIDDRIPVILHPEDYMRWLSEEQDPRDLLKPFPAELMTMWPVSTKVNAS
jgi:putative SOS response-associated peptidase YedK